MTKPKTTGKKKATQLERELRKVIPKRLHDSAQFRDLLGVVELTQPTLPKGVELHFTKLQKASGDGVFSECVLSNGTSKTVLLGIAFLHLEPRLSFFALTDGGSPRVTTLAAAAFRAAISTRTARAVLDTKTAAEEPVAEQKKTNTRTWPDDRIIRELRSLLPHALLHTTRYMELAEATRNVYATLPKGVDLRFRKFDPDSTLGRPLLGDCALVGKESVVSLFGIQLDPRAQTISYVHVCPEDPDGAGVTQLAAKAFRSALASSDAQILLTPPEACKPAPQPLSEWRKTLRQRIPSDLQKSPSYKRLVQDITDLQQQLPSGVRVACQQVREAKLKDLLLNVVLEREVASGKPAQTCRLFSVHRSDDTLTYTVWTDKGLRQYTMEASTAIQLSKDNKSVLDFLGHAAPTEIKHSEKRPVFVTAEALQAVPQEGSELLRAVTEDIQRNLLDIGVQVHCTFINAKQTTEFRDLGSSYRAIILKAGPADTRTVLGVLALPANPTYSMEVHWIGDDGKHRSSMAHNREGLDECLRAAMNTVKILRFIRRNLNNGASDGAA